ncbi:MAG: hypothetical protein Q9178_000906 [Gyalolechia marmorata]
MPATDSPAVLCARFLEANNYHDQLQNQTLQAFLTEANLPPNTGTLTNPNDLTIEKILEEKKIFDLSLRFEKFGCDGDDDNNNGGRGWRLPAPEFPWLVKSLPSTSNLLHVSIEDIIDEDSGGDGGGEKHHHQLLFATTADRRLHILQPNHTFPLQDSLSHIHDSPILSCTILPLGSGGMVSLTTSMSGQVIVYDHRAKRVLDERRDHGKFVVRCAWMRDGEGEGEKMWVATAGWDGKVFVYRVVWKDGDGDSNSSWLGDPVASLSLATNPETVTFVGHPDDGGRPVLVVTRRDSTFLHYYLCEEEDRGLEEEEEEEEEEEGDGTSLSAVVNLRFLGSQNLAPHSNAWISFTPSSVAICPTDPQLLAIATSAVPHMKLIVVRMLIPAVSPAENPGTAREVANQASQTRWKLAVEEQEDAAIRLNVNTFAPQTPYSTPQLCWRPDGSGVWVNGDDGALRGFEATTGKICATLKGGHEPGSKIRSVWAGMVDVGEKQEEWMISGGFDKRLVVWKSCEEGKVPC